MERFLEIVCGLILLLLLYSLLEMILPEGGLSRFVRLVMGLTLLAVAVQPLARILPRLNAAGERELLPALAPFQEETEDYAAQGAEISRRLGADLRREQEEQAAARLAALAKVAPGVEEARARATLDGEGRLAGAVLYLEAEDMDRAQREVKELICGFCLLSEEQVECLAMEGYHE